MSRPPARAPDLARPALQVARDLLGRELVSRVDHECVVVRLTEVEAYEGEGEDVASHAHRGRTARNGTMFGPPGRAYVYRSYGLHWMLNIVCEPEGRAAAVLVRSGAVVEGRTVAARRRGLRGRDADDDRRLARGPANLAQALGVTGALDGEVLGPGHALELLPGGPVDDVAVARGPRVGLGSDDGRPWRLFVAGDRTVTAWRAGGRSGRGVESPAGAVGDGGP